MATQTEEWEKFAKNNLKIETIFVSAIKTALKKQYSSFIDDLQTLGIDYATQQMRFYPWNSDMIVVLRKIYKRAGLLGAVTSYRELLNDTKDTKYRGFGFNQEWIDQVLEYLQIHILNKAVIPITETTKKFILLTVEKAVEEGRGIDWIVNRITDNEILETRARIIARTETIRAANTGHMIGAKKFPYEVTKGWLAARDHRTRHSHRAVNGQKVDEDEKFSNGLLYPGDPEGSAKETINCRCRVIYKAKRDTNGRIIPRRSQLPLTSTLKDATTHDMIFI